MSNPNQWITKGLQLSEEMHMKKHVARKPQKTSERQTSSLLVVKKNPLSVAKSPTILIGFGGVNGW